MNTTGYLHSHFVWLKLSYLSIVKTPFRALGGSRLGVFQWTPGNVKLLLPPRQSRGISYGFLGQTLQLNGTDSLAGSTSESRRPGGTETLRFVGRLRVRAALEQQLWSEGLRLLSNCVI